METIAKLSWGLLALLHAVPSLVLFSPTSAARLYGVDPSGDVGVLVVHRAAMFVTVVVVSLYAIYDRSVRRTAGLVTAISMVAFLLVYARAGMPEGPLQGVARADLAGLVPLAVVLFDAWRAPAAD